MAEGLAERTHLPGKKITSVYGEWAKGGWGALLTGMTILNGFPELIALLDLMM